MKRKLTSMAVVAANLENRMGSIADINEKKLENKALDRDKAVDAIFDVLEGMPTDDALNVLTGALMAAIDTLPIDSQNDVKRQLIDHLTPKTYNH